jgi:hypothetical protein
MTWTPTNCVAFAGMAALTILIIGKLATEFMLPVFGRQPIVLLSHRRSMQASIAIIWLTLVAVFLCAVLGVP